MDVSANGQDMYVSSYDGQVKDPFAEQTIVSDNKNSVPSSEDLTDSTISNYADNTQYN